MLNTWAEKSPLVQGIHPEQLINRLVCKGEKRNRKKLLYSNGNPTRGLQLTNPIWPASTLHHRVCGEQSQTLYLSRLSNSLLKGHCQQREICFFWLVIASRYSTSETKATPKPTPRLPVLPSKKQSRVGHGSEQTT